MAGERPFEVFQLGLGVRLLADFWENPHPHRGSGTETWERVMGQNPKIGNVAWIVGNSTWAKVSGRVDLKKRAKDARS